MRIAIFDHKMTRNNPIGSCHLAILRGLAAEHEFTVFAVEFDNPCPEKIRFVRVHSPMRPIALLFVVYHFMAPLSYWFYRLRGGPKFDLIQTLESNLTFGDLLYTHFCHRMYLKNHFGKSGAKGLRGLFRWVDHQLHALMEGFTYPRAKQVVTISRGMARELKAAFPYVDSKLTVLPNPVRLDRLMMPADFDRPAFRHGLGINDDDLVGIFVALGQFERKGLPLLLQALSAPGMERLKLLVVGGEPDLIAPYAERAAKLQLGKRVIFAGMQSDVRPYFWSADAFVFPSLYEGFPLVALEAAASGLPIVVSQLYGVEDMLMDRESAIIVPTTVDGVKGGLERFLNLSPAERLAMGQEARKAVSVYSEDHFVAAWRDFYSAFYSKVNPTGTSPAGELSREQSETLTGA